MMDKHIAECNEKIKIREYKLPIDVIAFVILRFVRYSNFDDYLTYFGLTENEREIIKRKVYAKRLTITSPMYYCTYYTVDKSFHRDDDLPAEMRRNDFFNWFKHGKRHRDGDLPAILWTHHEDRYSAQGYIIIDGDSFMYNSYLIVDEMLEKDTSSGSSQLQYLDGNHPRLSNMAVVGVFDGVRFLDPRGIPIVDNGPIMLCYSWGRIYHDDKYIGEFVNRYFPLGETQTNTDSSLYEKNIKLNWPNSPNIRLINNGAHNNS